MRPPKHQRSPAASLTRRAFLGGAVAVAAAATAGATSALGWFHGEAESGQPRWPGHQPGKIYLGMSSPDVNLAVASVGEVGAHRSFYDWDDLSRELPVIAEAHQARRLPWTSFKPPAGAVRPWADVASGMYDADLEARADAYETIAGSLLVTFHHEPHGDDEEGTPAEWAAAWAHVHDVLRTRRLDHVALVPVIGEWVFNPANTRQDPAEFFTDDDPEPRRPSRVRPVPERVR